MRISTAIAGLALLAPTVLAQSQEDSWSSETTVTVTSSFSTTLTITKYLTFANATTTSTMSIPVAKTGWNITRASTSATSTVNPPALTAPSSTNPFVLATATGAATLPEINLAVAALAGAAAFAWGSL